MSEERARGSAVSLPTADDVTAAAARLDGVAVRTPVLESDVLNRRAGISAMLKIESLQRTGSFKFRGAYNRLAQLTDAERAAGVVAFSSGNHAQGIAAAARLLGVPATIVMPADAPAVKLEGTRRLGAEIVPYERDAESREEIAAALAAERGAVLVPAFDDPMIVAGQGTVGLELIDAAAAAGRQLDAVYVCVGGGGLIAGCALAIKRKSPETRIYAVEPVAFDDTRRSLAAGRRVSNGADAKSFCDALLAPMPGEITFALNRTLLAGGLAVSDEEVAHAMAFAFRHLKVVLEPGGAVALAALLHRSREIDGAFIGVVCSGGNVDADVFARCLHAHPAP